MAEAPSLNDFFKKDKKKKIKGSNLNTALNEKPAEEKKETKKTKAEEEEGWHEEEVVQATMKVEVAGKLVREEEREKEEESAAPAWGVIKQKETRDAKDERRFPSLAKSVASSAINLEDKSGQVNITTSKNMFANLENEDDDEDGVKRPKDIKPALVSKKKGEREKDAIQREVSKYKDPKKDGKAGAEEDADGEDAEAEKEAKPKKKEDKKAKSSSVLKENVKDEQDEHADLQIQPDHEAIKAKYVGRKKLPKKSLPAEELEEEKENKPQKQVGKKKKAWAQMDEEEDKKLVEIDADD